jgi:hypothetical protein
VPNPDYSPIEGPLLAEVGEVAGVVADRHHHVLERLKAPARNRPSRRRTLRPLEPEHDALQLQPLRHGPIRKALLSFAGVVRPVLGDDDFGTECGALLRRTLERVALMLSPE